MIPLIRFFYAAARPRVTFATGGVAMLAMAASRFLGADADEATYWGALGVLVLCVLASVGMTCDEPWLLHLPASRKRIYHAMFLGGLGSLLPPLVLIAGGLVLFGDMTPRWVFAAACLLLLSMVTTLALLPMQWSWPRILTVSIWTAALCWIVFMGAGGLTGDAQAQGSIALTALVAMVLIYWGGCTAFGRFDWVNRSHRDGAAGPVTASPGGLKAGNLVDAARDIPLGRDALPRDRAESPAPAPVPAPGATVAAEPGAMVGTSPATPPKVAPRLSPPMQLLQSVCWFRFAYLGMLVVTFICALFITLSKSVEPAPDPHRIFFLLNVVHIPRMARWLRMQLPWLLSLPRGWVYQGFSIPLIAAWALASLLAFSLAGVGGDDPVIRQASELYHRVNPRFDVPASLGRPVLGNQHGLLPMVAERVTNDYAIWLGLRLSPVDVLRADADGHPIVTTAHLRARITAARRWQCVHIALALLVVAVCSLRVGLVSPPRRWTRDPAVICAAVGWVYIFWMAAELWLPATRDAQQGVLLIRLEPQAVVRQCLLDYRWAVAAGLALLALVVQRSNARAFSQAEWLPPYDGRQQRRGWWRTFGKSASPYAQD